MATVDPNYVEVTEFEVWNISEFLESIKNHLYLKEDIYSIMLRGESQKYTTRLASIFRGRNSFSHLSKMLDLFHRDTHNLFTTHDQEALMALGQHYGLKTQLLDITNQPLTALYFAVNDESNANDSQLYNGYIYTFDSFFELNLSDILPLNKPISLNDLFLDSPEITKKLISKISTSTTLCMGANFGVILNEIQSSLQALPTNLRYFLGGAPLRIYQLLEALESYISTPEAYDEESNLPCRYLITNELVKEDFESVFNLLNIDLEDSTLEVQLATIYVSLCSFILSDLSKVRLKNQEIDSNILTFLPNFYYRPVLDDNRLNLQKGFFFVQLPLLSLGRIQYIQNIPESYTFIIPKEAKLYISKELELLGINQKTIYGDPDHIANYINNAFENNDIY